GGRRHRRRPRPDAGRAPAPRGRGPAPAAHGRGAALGRRGPRARPRRGRDAGDAGGGAGGPGPRGPGGDRARGAPARRVEPAGSGQAVASSSRGRSRILVSEESSTGRAAATCPAEATHSVGTTPIVPPSRPPRTPPIGTVPQTMKRTEAFIRPSSSAGQRRCRKLTWVML